MTGSRSPGRRNARLDLALPATCAGAARGEPLAAAGRHSRASTPPGVPWAALDARPPPPARVVAFDGAGRRSTFQAPVNAPGRSSRCGDRAPVGPGRSRGRPPRAGPRPCRAGAGARLRPGPAAGRRGGRFARSPSRPAAGAAARYRRAVPAVSRRAGGECRRSVRVAGARVGASDPRSVAGARGRRRDDGRDPGCQCAVLLDRGPSRVSR
jgi:hypothetical protein